MLFSLPWACVLAVRALPVAGGWRRAVVVTGVLALLTALFLPSFFGQEKLNIQPADQVAAAEHLYTEGERGLPIATATPDFPVRVGARYDEYGPDTQNVPNLIEYPEFQHRDLGEADVANVVRFMSTMGERGYLVFSTTQESYAEIYQLAPPGALRELEAALVDSGQFTVWSETPNT
nr:hypothetical protein [Micromonospora sp. DSM 115978]